METAMRFECASFLGKFLIVTALSVASLAYSQQSLPGCEPAPEVRKALNEELNGKQLEKMPFADRVARRRDIYEKLIVNNPREVEPYRGLIEYTRRMQEYLDPTPMSALQERFRKQAALHPDDPLALYVAGVALFGADTPESLLCSKHLRPKHRSFPGQPSRSRRIIQLASTRISNGHRKI